ncbi:MAG: enoyl-CoA hydratase-related protein [Peptoniphilus sp.]|nr:enoyl-CoA hydratase-related protein [Peptoniphilus sp.]MDD7362860.1 enoyl-CoA hydratase-related protein [Bacillota bacterium]MDY6043948.1 enoyl-CoA hydratase-related protein [Peptoniphilus sp.]
MKTKNFDTLSIERDEDIAIIYFNRPEAMNSLTLEMVDDIRSALESLKRDETVRGIIFTGSGDRAFMAGADLSIFADMGPLELHRFSEYGQTQICSYIENFPKPTVAAINGYALGGGSELAMCCDIRIAGEKASFSQPEINFGIMPIYAATKRLQRLVGFGRAKELIMTGRRFDAKEAERIGYVTRVVAPEALLSTAKETLRQIFKNAPLSVHFAKLAVNRAADLPMDTACAMEREMAATLFGTEDKAEGIEAFLEKRPANYRAK